MNMVRNVRSGLGSLERQSKSSRYVHCLELHSDLAGYIYTVHSCILIDLAKYEHSSELHSDLAKYEHSELHSDLARYVYFAGLHPDLARYVRRAELHSDLAR